MFIWIPERASSAGNRIWFRITEERHIWKLEGIKKVFRPKWPYDILRKLRPREVKWLAQGDSIIVTIATTEVASPSPHSQSKSLFYSPKGFVSFLLYKKTKRLQGYLMVSATMKKMSANFLDTNTSCSDNCYHYNYAVCASAPCQFSESVDRHRDTIIKYAQVPVMTPHGSRRQSFVDQSPHSLKVPHLIIKNLTVFQWNYFVHSSCSRSSACGTS